MDLEGLSVENWHRAGKAQGMGRKRLVRQWKVEGGRSGQEGVMRKAVLGEESGK